MSMMTKLLTAGALAAAMTAGAAQASTVIQSGVSGNPKCNVTGSSANTSANIDVLAGASYTEFFTAADSAGNLCFNFKNSSALDAAVAFTVATVNQGLELWGFTGGVQILSEQLGGELWNVSQGINATTTFSFMMAAGSTQYFDWTYGTPYVAGEGLQGPFINFSVKATPVPVPAAGLLLLAALGGIAALRRRQTA